jgi:hypothetical protein
MLDAVRKREAKDQRETKIRELEAEVNKLVAAIAKVEEPDGADSEAPFWRRRRLHPRTLLPDSAFPAGADAAPVASAPLPASRCAPTAGSAGGRSGTADISPASRATAPRCPESREHRSAQHGSHATGGSDYPLAVTAAAPAPPRPTVHRSVPSVLSRRFAVIPEQPQDRTNSPFRYL